MLKELFGKLVFFPQVAVNGLQDGVMFGSSDDSDNDRDTEYEWYCPYCRDWTKTTKNDWYRPECPDCHNPCDPYPRKK